MAKVDARIDTVNPFPDLSGELDPTSRTRVIIHTEINRVEGVRFDVMLNQYNDLIRKMVSQAEWLCGYVTYPDVPPVAADVSLQDYISVHGGITYDRNNKDGSYTIGFDCAHGDDDRRDYTNDPTWVLAEAKNMHEQIKLLVQERQETE